MLHAMAPIPQPVYQNVAANASVQAVEFAACGNQYRSFIQLAPGADLAHITQWLTHAPFDQRIEAMTSGEAPLIITAGSLTPSAFIEALAGQGENLRLPTPPTSFDPWKWRAATSVAGQSLQIASSYASTGHHSDRRAMFGFATLNMTANVMNWIFGAQEKHDLHRLRLLKSQLNEQLAPLVGDASLPVVDEQRMQQRPAQAQHGMGQKAYNFLQRYSVTGGEIGLRVIGSAALAFPHPIKAIKTLVKTGSLLEAHTIAKNPVRQTYLVGLTMLAGKFTSLLAKEPDPYNPQPPSPWRRFREAVAFPLSSVIEGGAATFMGIDKYRNGRIKLFGKELNHDYLNALGNASFIGGYAIRFRAPYGSLHVDMPELYAHISDCLAQLPAEQRPAVLAHTAQRLAQHFHGEHSVGQIYQGIVADYEIQHGSTRTDTGTAVHTITHLQRLAEPNIPLQR